MLATTKGCDLRISADGEDELVTKVQAHVAEAHAQGHAPTREQVLAVVRARLERES